MEAADPNPSDKRDNVVLPAPKSFTPEYGKNTVKSAGDLASEENKKNADAIKAKEAAEAEEAAKLAAE